MWSSFRLIGLCRKDVTKLSALGAQVMSSWDGHMWPSYQLCSLWSIEQCLLFQDMLSYELPASFGGFEALCVLVVVNLADRQAASSWIPDDFVEDSGLHRVSPKQLSIPPRLCRHFEFLSPIAWICYELSGRLWPMLERPLHAALVVVIFQLLLFGGFQVLWGYHLQTTDPHRLSLIKGSEGVWLCCLSLLSLLCFDDSICFWDAKSARLHQRKDMSVDVSMIVFTSRHILW